MKKITLPAQYKSKEEAETVQSTASAVEGGTISAMSSNFFINLLLVASVNHLWSAINGLQILVYMPLFWIKFPANANTMNLFLIDIATFDLFPSDDLNQSVLVLPESQPYNINFQQTGIESVYAISNIGTVLYIIILYVFMILIERLWSCIV